MPKVLKIYGKLKKTGRIKAIKAHFLHLKTLVINMIAPDDMRQAIDKTYDLYFQMMTLTELAHYASNVSDGSSGEKVQTFRPHPNTRFIDNAVMVARYDSPTATR